MRAKLALATTIAAMSATSLAFADTYVVRERAEVVHTDDYHPNQGVEVEGYAGAGYGIGAGARLGTTVVPDVYLGGAFTYYTGNAVFLGGELGYKFWPGRRWELRPYLFMGPAFARVSDEGFGRRPGQSEVLLAFQPGFIGAYHFGPAYLAMEGRAYVAPNPGALVLLGGVGVNL